MITIDAKNKWNRTGIILKPGSTYLFEVSDINDWRDAGLSADPEKGVFNPSFFQDLFKFLIRDKGENWFVLIGSIGKNKKTFFKIGGGGKCTIPSHFKEGELLCFANDAYSFYCNNHGSLKLHVTCLDA